MSFFLSVWEIENLYRLVTYLDIVQIHLVNLKEAFQKTDAELDHLEQAILSKAVRGEL